MSFWKRVFGGGGEPEEKKGQYGVDYVGVSEMLAFNRNLVEALNHEKQGVELYSRFLSEANDERGREMYRKLIDEEKQHLRMVRDEIEEHRKQGFWS
jgi:rubrerythrin